MLSTTSPPNPVGCIHIVAAGFNSWKNIETQLNEDLLINQSRRDAPLVATIKHYLYHRSATTINKSPDSVNAQGNKFNTNPSP